MSARWCLDQPKLHSQRSGAWMKFHPITCPGSNPSHYSFQRFSPFSLQFHFSCSQHNAKPSIYTFFILLEKANKRRKTKEQKNHVKQQGRQAQAEEGELEEEASVWRETQSTAKMGKQKEKKMKQKPLRVSNNEAQSSASWNN